MLSVFEDMIVYYAFTKKFNEEFYDFALETIPNEKKEKINRISFLKSKHESLLSWFLFSVGIKKLMPDEEYEIAFAHDGKPFVKDKNLYFNISHSHGLCMCAFSKDNVGIDCEKIHFVSEKVKNKVLSEKERPLISSDEDFIRLWTVKESFLKHSGEGLNGIFDLDFSEQIKKECFEAYGLTFSSIRLKDYFCTFCSKDSEFELIAINNESFS